GGVGVGHPWRIIWTQAHVHAARAERGELIQEASEPDAADVRRDGHLETRPAARAEGILDDRLRRVGREPATVVAIAARVLASRHEASRDVCRRLARLDHATPMVERP